MTTERMTFACTRCGAPETDAEGCCEICGECSLCCTCGTFVDRFEVPCESIECRCCGGEGVLMGILGNREHFRCRNCGVEMSREVE